jgi:O-antigen ligase
VVLPAAAAAVAVWRRPALQRADVVVVGALLLYAAWVVVDALAQGELHPSLHAVGSAVGFATCFAIGRTFDARDRTALRFGAILVGALEAAVGLVGVALRIDPLALPAHEHLRLAGTLTYSNAMGALLALTLVAALTCPASRRRDAALALISGGVIATQSRGVLLAVLLALLLLWRRVGAAIVPLGLGLLLGVVAVAGSGDASRHPELVLLAAALPVLAAALPTIEPRVLLVAAGLLLVAIAQVATLSDGLREAAHSRLSMDSVEDRTDAWHAAWSAFVHSPIAGVGPGLPLHLEDGRVVQFVHNEPLQVALDTGLVGLVLVGAAFAGPLLAPRTRPRVVAVPALMAVFVGSALSDYQWHLPAITMTAGLLLTGLPAAPDRSRTRR